MVPENQTGIACFISSYLFVVYSTFSNEYLIYRVQYAFSV